MHAAAWCSRSVTKSSWEEGGPATAAIEIVSERADGARADWSNRGEEDGVDVILLQPAGAFAGMRFHWNRVARSHKRVATEPMTR